MRKNFISSKTAIGFMAFTLLLTGMTGCYKDSRLDVTDPNTGTVVIPAAVYSISGTVSDAETGAPVECTVTADLGTVNNIGNGAYNVSLTKEQVGEGATVGLTFTPADAKYQGTTRTVRIEKIEDGSSIVYPVSVSLNKKVEEVKYNDVEYKLNITFVDSETNAEINGVDYRVETTAGGQLENGNYKAGEYLIKSEQIDGKYYGSVTALSLADFKIKEGENNVTTRNIVIGLNAITATPAPVEYVTILGDVRDVNNNAVVAKEVTVKDYNQSMYNVSNFNFKLEKKEGVNVIVIEAKVLNEKGDGFVPTTAKITLNDENTRYITVKFPFAVKDGQIDTSAGSGSTSVSVVGNPERDEEGKTVAEVSTEMTDANTGAKTTVTIPAGTKIENLGDNESIVVSGNATTDNSEVQEPAEGGETGGTTIPVTATDGTVVIKSFTGTPDGVKFTPAIKVTFEDEYNGDLGESFALQYLDETTNTWAVDEEGGSITYADGSYTMNVAHFSTFRASMSIDPKIVAATDSTTIKEPVENGANEEENALNGFKLTYKGYVGSRYADYQKLVDDVNANFSNEKARSLVLNSILGMNPTARKTNFDTQDYYGTTNIPAWTQLNSFNVTTKVEKKTYTVTVNKKTITFVVENVVSVKISVTDDNKTSIGHGHGHGNGNNAGGGIITGD